MLRIFLLLLTIPLWGVDEYIQDLSYGKVNWSQGTIVVTGSGVSSLRLKKGGKATTHVEREALNDAYKNALEVVKNLQVDHERSVSGLLRKNQKLYQHLQKVFKQGKIKGKKYYDDGGIDLLMEIPIATLLSWENYFDKTVKPLDNGSNKEYTGLIIDARRVKMKKYLLPRIKSESGQYLYRGEMFQKKLLKKRPLIRYCKRIRCARKLVGKKALVLSAKGIAPGDPSEIVISDMDAVKLFDKDLDRYFLGEGRVVIVTR